MVAPSSCLATAPSGGGEAFSLWSLEADQLTALHADGTIHATTLPCPALGMWPLAHGVLLGKDVAAVTGGGGPRADFGHEPPLLYVRHPLDHVHDVSCDSAWSDSVLAACRTSLSLVLSHSASASRHAVWAFGRREPAPPIPAFADGPPDRVADQPHLRLLWQAPAAVPAAAAFFLCASHAAVYLCLVQAELGLLHAYRIGLPSGDGDDTCGGGKSAPQLPSRSCGSCPAIAARPVRPWSAADSFPQIACLDAGGRTTFWVLSGCALHPILTHHSAAAPTPGLLPSPTVTAAALSAALGPNAPAQPLPFQDELNALCLSALAATGAAAYARLLAHVRESGVGGGRGSAGAGMASEPWSLFCVGLWLWLGIEPRGGAPLAPASPWERVLCSRTHTRLSAAAVVHGLAAAVPCRSRPNVQPKMPTNCVAAEAHDCLHGLYESLKLSTLTWPMLTPLGEALAHLATALRRPLHSDQYRRDLDGVRTAASAAAESARQALAPGGGGGGDLDAPHDVFAAAARALAPPPAPPPPSLLPAGASRAWGELECGAARLHADVAQCYAAAFDPPAVGVDAKRSAAEAVVLTMAQRGLGSRQLEAIPLGLALPLHEAIRACRHAAPADWPEEAYALIGREDLARDLRPTARSAPITLPSGGEAAATGGAGEDDLDGMLAVIAAAGLRFRRDLRLHEVRRLLCSSRPIALRLGGVGAPREPVEADQTHQQQAQLAVLCRRATALGVGRGMFTLASAPAERVQSLQLAPLVLQGHTSPKGATIELDTSALETDHLLWPEFHNGCACALRLQPPGCGPAAHGELGRHWIMYSRPKTRRHAYAGVLMGLGLQGHLVALANTDIYRFMAQGHDVTMMSMLIGMSAARRGSMHPAIAKMLCLHIPALHPPSFTELELEVQAIVQIAALLGIGLLYQASGQRLMTEVMLGEIARPPTNELLSCRESYALTAGLALGMIALGRGSDAAGLADLRIEDRLCVYIHGQGSTHSGGAAGYSAGGQRWADRGGARPSSHAARCYRIREGPGVNVDVTAAGAVLALGLIFAKSGNTSVAAQLGVLRTAHALHSVRPGLILLRVVARNLILWDTIRPTTVWLESQLTLSPAEAAVAPAGGRADAQTLGLAYVNSRAGACLALGLRFAGSASAPTAQLLIDQVQDFEAARATLAAAAAVASTPSTRAELATIETCLGTAAVALACVMAGTGDRCVLRLLRVLRRRADADVSYGFHMSISMAIGLLFLGGGRLTLGTSKPALAALVTALFPRYPLTPMDNRYHLQAFRHLYVLAAEARCLEAVDVDTDEPAMVPLRVLLRRSERLAGDQIDDASVWELERVTPCLLPPLSIIRSVATASPRYWGRELLVADRPEHAAALRRRVLWVKRKTGHLPYTMDGRGLASIFCRPFGAAPFQRERTLQAFCNEAVLLAFAQHMCAAPASAPRLREFCEAILYECLTEEKAELIPAYLHLYHLALRLQRAGGAPVAMPSLRLLAAYAPSSLAARLAAGGGPREPPIQLPFLRLLCHHVETWAARREPRARGAALGMGGPAHRPVPTLAEVIARIAIQSRTT